MIVRKDLLPNGNLTEMNSSCDIDMPVMLRVR